MTEIGIYVQKACNNRQVMVSFAPNIPNYISIHHYHFIERWSYNDKKNLCLSTFSFTLYPVHNGVGEGTWKPNVMTIRSHQNIFVSAEFLRHTLYASRIQRRNSMPRLSLFTRARKCKYFV